MGGEECEASGGGGGGGGGGGERDVRLGWRGECESGGGERM